MKIRIRRKSSTSAAKGIPVFLLVTYLVALAFYIVLMEYARVPNTIPQVASLGMSAQGLFLGAFSLGFLSLFLISLLTAISILLKWKRGASIGTPGLGAAIAVGLLMGASFTLIPITRQQPQLSSVQDSSGGFTLVVYYNSTTLTIGRNLTMKYVLTDDSYQLVTPYQFFGGQFSMVFYNSTGKQVVAFRAPVAFKLATNQYNVALQPGESWNTLLSWNGTVIPLNGTRYIASPGEYSLASYAVLNDVNASLYVVLHPPNISIKVVKG